MAAFSARHYRKRLAVLREQQQTILRDHQRQSRALLDLLPQRLYRVDVEGRVVFLNQPMLQDLGIPLEDCLGKTANDSIRRNWRKSIRPMISGCWRVKP